MTGGWLAHPHRPSPVFLTTAPLTQGGGEKNGRRMERLDPAGHGSCRTGKRRNGHPLPNDRFGVTLHYFNFYR